MLKKRFQILLVLFFLIILLALPIFDLTVHAVLINLYVKHYTQSLGGSTCYLMSNVPPSVDGVPVEIPKYPALNGEVIFCRSIKSLNGTASMDAATWTIKFRHRTSVTSQSHTLKVHLYILKSGGSLRQDLGIVTLGTWTNHNNYITRTINYAFGGYTVVDQTDYFAVDWIHKSVGGAGYTAYFLFDSPSVANADNSQIANWTYSEGVTIGNFQAPSTVYAQQFFFLNTTITQSVSRNKIVNATVQLIGSIILKWINVTNTFSIGSDPSGYCTINISLCIKANLNNTSIKLSWWISFHWNYTEGYMDIIYANTMAWDNEGHFGHGSYDNLFYFEDDLIIDSASLVDPDRVDPSSSNTVSAVVYYEGTSTAPYGISGFTVYLELDGVVKGSNSTVTASGETTLEFTAEATTDSYPYLVYALTDDPSIQNKTVAVIVERVKVGFTVDDNDVWNGTTVSFTTTFQSEYDNTYLTGCYYDVKRNGTLWQSNIHTNFTDVHDDPWDCFLYDFYQMNANNWNLTQIVSMPSDITVLWYGYGAAAPPSAPVSSGGMLIVGMSFGLIFALLFIGVRLKKSREKESNGQVFYSLSYRIRKVRKHGFACRV
jgi:hypothetical protein